MAEETIIIDVQFKANDVAKKLGQVNKEIKELTDANRVLRNEIKNGNDIMGENSLKLAENESKLKSLNSEKRNYLGIVEEEMRDNKSYGTSINDLRDKLRSLTATYNSLSAAERESDFGKNIQKEAEKTQKEISELNQKIGNFRDNVGNYKTALTGFLEKIGGKWSELARLIIANPIGLAISALVVLYNKLKSSFEKGDEAGKKLKNAMSNLQPIFDVFNSAISAVVNTIASFIELSSRLISSIFPGLESGAKKTATAFDFIGLSTEESIENFKKFVKELTEFDFSVDRLKEQIEKVKLLLDKGFDFETATLGFNRYMDEIYKNAEEHYEKLDKEADLLHAIYMDHIRQESRFFKEMNPFSTYDGTWENWKKAEDEFVKEHTAKQKKLYEEAELSRLNYSREMKSFQELVKSANSEIYLYSFKSVEELNKLNREFIENEAIRNKRIAELRRISLDEDKYDFENRKNFLSMAIELEKQNLKESLDIARKKYEDEKSAMEKSENNSDKALLNLANLNAARLNAEQNYNEGVIKLNKELESFIREHNEEIKRLEEEKYKEIKSGIESILKQAIELEKEFNKSSIEIMTDGLDKEIATLKNGYKEEIRLLEEKEKEIEQILEQSNKLGYTIPDSELSALNEQLETIAEIKINKEQELQLEIQKIRQDYRLQELEDAYYAIENKYAMEIQLNRRKEVELADINKKIAKEYRQYLEGLSQDQIDSLFISEQAYQLALVTAMQEEEAAIAKRNQILSSHVEKTLSAIDKLYGSVSSLFDAFDAESESSKNAQKAIAMSQLAFSTGAAIAKGISEAAAAGPFPQNLAAIATTVATILANIATARKFFDEKSSGYESGGIVPGASYTGDRITANVNSGEMILTREQQKALFRMANTNLATNNNYDVLVSGLSEALKNQPAPVLNYEEFTNFSNDVANKNKLILK